MVLEVCVKRIETGLSKQTLNGVRSRAIKESQKKNRRATFFLLAGNEKIEISPRDIVKFVDLLIQNNQLEGDILSTQEVADLLNVSRPYVVKLIEDKKIPAFKVGPQRRILAKDAFAYRTKMRAQQLQALDELTSESEKYGLDF